MCGPAAIMAVQMGIGAAGSIEGAIAKDKAARQAWGSTITDLEGQYSATQLREQQEMSKAQMDVFQAQRSGQSLTSRVRVQSASGGVGGATAAEREQTVGNNVENYASTSKVNLANELRQNQLDAKGFLAKAQTQINENQPETGLSLGLDLASQAASMGQKAMPPAGTSAAGSLDTSGSLDALNSPDVLSGISSASSALA